MFSLSGFLTPDVPDRKPLPRGRMKLVLKSLFSLVLGIALVAAMGLPSMGRIMQNENNFADHGVTAEMP